MKNNMYNKLHIYNVWFPSFETEEDGDIIALTEEEHQEELKDSSSNEVCAWTYVGPYQKVAS